MTDMRDLVDGLADQLRWASSLTPVGIPAAGEILVCGMGGSGVSGDYLARIADPAGRRVTVSKGYGLPGWAASARPLVIAVSFSGNTEETLTAVTGAEAAGLEIVAISTGGELTAWAEERGRPLVAVPEGPQPRAALGWMLGAAARVAEAAGVLSGTAADLEEAAAVVDTLTRGPGWPLAADLAAGLAGRVVVVYGSEGLTSAVAGRWKTQINENAKSPAWSSVFPELDHNEIEAWTGAPELGTDVVGIVVLRDEAEPEAVERRIRITREVTQTDVRWVGEVRSQGRSALARMMSLTVVGDMVSVELAAALGVDPMPVDAIEDLKLRLREDSLIA
jgi:glucose/mannose-6-phosphate isomerase